MVIAEAVKRDLRSYLYRLHLMSEGRWNATEHETWGQRTAQEDRVWPIRRFKIPKRRRSSQDPKTSDPFFMLYTVHAKYWFLSLFCMRVHHIVDDADLIAYQMWNEFTCFTSVGIKLCVNWGIHYEILWLHCMSSNLIAYDAMCTYCVDVRWSTHPLKQMRCVSYLYVICGRNNNECWRSWLK